MKKQKDTKKKPNDELPEERKEREVKWILSALGYNMDMRIPKEVLDFAFEMQRQLELSRGRIAEFDRGRGDQTMIAITNNETASRFAYTYGYDKGVRDTIQRLGKL